MKNKKERQTMFVSTCLSSMSAVPYEAGKRSCLSVKAALVVLLFALLISAPLCHCEAQADNQGGLDKYNNYYFVSSCLRESNLPDSPLDISSFGDGERLQVCMHFVAV